VLRHACLTIIFFTSSFRNLLAEFSAPIALAIQVLLFNFGQKSVFEHFITSFYFFYLLLRR